jgi:hypothetical protein
MNLNSCKGNAYFFTCQQKGIKNMKKEKENKRGIKGKTKVYLLTEEQYNNMIGIVQGIGRIENLLMRLTRRNSSKVTLGAGIGEAKALLNQQFTALDDLAIEVCQPLQDSPTHQPQRE